jgi:hypothetical protein
MLQHNGRLANPIDQWAQLLKALTSKRKKTDEDLAAIRQVEARGGCWETRDGLLGIPTSAVWRSIYDAATAYKLGASVKRALHFSDETIPLLVGGETVFCDDYLADAANIDYRPVVVNRVRTMRARPLVHPGWVSTHQFNLLDDVIDIRELVPVLERAGRLVGLGDWRPTYGTYDVEVLV